MRNIHTSPIDNSALFYASLQIYLKVSIIYTKSTRLTYIIRRIRTCFSRCDQKDVVILPTVSLGFLAHCALIWYDLCDLYAYPRDALWHMNGHRIGSNSMICTT